MNTQWHMENDEFKTLYTDECNVCANTARIFARADHEGLSTASLAQSVNALPETVEALCDADHCDPQLVIRLCRLLGFQPPKTCPKLNTNK